MSQKQSNKLIVSDEHYNLYMQFVRTPQKNEGTTKTAKRTKPAKKTSRQLLFNENFQSCSCSLCNNRGRQSRDLLLEVQKKGGRIRSFKTGKQKIMDSNDDRKPAAVDSDNDRKPAAVDTAQLSQTTTEKTKKKPSSNKKPSTPKKKHKTNSEEESTVMDHQKKRPRTEVASLPTMDTGTEATVGAEYGLETPKSVKGKTGVGGKASKGVKQGSGQKYNKKKINERVKKHLEKNDTNNRDKFNEKRRETTAAHKKEIEGWLEKCDIKAVKFGGPDAQVEHLPPPNVSGENKEIKTTKETLTLLKGMGKFLIDNYEETVKPLLEIMVKKNGTGTVVPAKPGVSLIDGGRWEIFIDNLKTNQSTKCWEYLLALYLETSPEGQAFMSRGRGKPTLVKNKCQKFMEMVTTYMKNRVEKNCTGYKESGKEMQLSLRSIIFHHSKVVSQKVHTDMHRDGYQFVMQMYTGKAGDEEEYPMVATEEYKLPEGCLEKCGERMMLKKMAWEDLLLQWPGMEEDCHEELMDIITGQEKKEDRNHVISVLQHHSVPLLLQSDQPWEKLVTQAPADEKTLKTGTITVLNGGIPHAGPACEVGRVVLFATAEPDEGETKYDAYAQYCTTDVVVLLGRLVWNTRASRKLKKFMFLKLLDAIERDPPRAIDQYAVGEWKELETWSKTLRKKNKSANKLNDINKMLDKMGKTHSEEKFTK